MARSLIPAASPITPMKHLLFIIRHADYYSAALHVRCIARKFHTGQSLEWHLAGLRRALHASPNLRTA